MLSKLAEGGRDPERAAAELREAEGGAEALAIESITEADCVEAARLRPVTMAQGLSLADRICLVLAGRLGVPALTTDRSWVEAPVQAEVKLIR